VLPPVVVKQEHVERAADLEDGLKWSRDDYDQEEMECQRRALEEIVERRRGREVGGIIILSDDEDAPLPTNPYRIDTSPTYL
jgi:hypothetical protein